MQTIVNSPNSIVINGTPYPKGWLRVKYDGDKVEMFDKGDYGKPLLAGVYSDISLDGVTANNIEEIKNYVLLNFYTIEGDGMNAENVTTIAKSLDAATLEQAKDYADQRFLNALAETKGIAQVATDPGALVNYQRWDVIEPGIFANFPDEAASPIEVIQDDLDAGKVQLLGDPILNYWVKVIIPVDLLPYQTKVSTNELLGEALDIVTTDVYKSAKKPYDKFSVVFSDANLMDFANFWGSNLCVVKEDKSFLEKVFVSTTRAGTVVIGFATITAGVAAIVHTSTKVISGSGIHEFSFADLGSPDLSAYPTVYIVIRNSTSGTRCVNFKTGSNLNHFWFPAAGGTVTQSPSVEISYWCQISANDNFLLPRVVNGTSDFAQLTDTLANNDVVHVGAGTHTFIATVQIPSGKKIYGKGAKTIVKPASGVTLCFHVNQVEDVRLSDMIIEGNDAIDVTSSAIISNETQANTNANRGDNYGLYLQQANGAIIENLIIRKFNADALLVQHGGYQTGNVFTKGLKANNIFIEESYRGLHINTAAEYSQYSNITVLKSLIGGTIRGGNNNLVNAHFTQCRIGYHMDGTGATNNAHGCVSNISANHSYIYGVYLYGITNGQALNNVTVFFEGALIDGCKGVMWNGGQIGAGAYIIHENATGKNAFHNIMFTPGCGFVLSETPPSLKNNLYLDGSSSAGLNN